MSWQDSSTYRKVLFEGELKGRLDELRLLTLRLGSAKFGEANVPVVPLLINAYDIQRLEAVIQNILTALTWEEFLAPLLNGPLPPQAIG